VDVVSGEPLFASTKKYDSGCGWRAHGTARAGQRARDSDVSFGRWCGPRSARPTRTAHLGHSSTTVPKDEGGLRYCINSAALRFVTDEDLESQGYGEYLHLLRRCLEEGRNTTMSDTTQRAVLAEGVLGHAGLIRKQPVRPGDARRLQRRRRGETPLSSSRDPRRGIEIIFDPNKTSYVRSSSSSSRSTTRPRFNRQGNDRGASYPFGDLLRRRRAASGRRGHHRRREASGLWPGHVVTELSPSAPSGKRNRSTRTTSSTTQRLTRATSRVPTGYCHAGTANPARPRQISARSNFELLRSDTQRAALRAGL